MEIFMKEIGKTIRLLDMELIFILMEQNMKVNGKTIINTEKVFRLGLMEVSMMVIIPKGKRVDRENTHGEMEVIILAHGKIIR
jgi:hypothetical protein